MKPTIVMAIILKIITPNVCLLLTNNYVQYLWTFIMSIIDAEKHIIELPSLYLELDGGIIDSPPKDNVVF
jgi:hypothetical protein